MSLSFDSQLGAMLLAAYHRLSASLNIEFANNLDGEPYGLPQSL